MVTLHRPSNVDDPDVLGWLVEALCHIGRWLPVIFPAHPRTVDRLKRFCLADRLDQGGVRLLEPLGYVDFLHLMAHAWVILTDSGGIQEETTVLGVPCLTLRSNTKRPVTITEGTNTLLGTDPDRILTETEHISNNGGKIGRIPKLWDGRAAERIVSILRQQFCQ